MGTSHAVCCIPCIPCGGTHHAGKGVYKNMCCGGQGKGFGWLTEKRRTGGGLGGESFLIKFRFRFFLLLSYNLLV